MSAIYNSALVLHKNTDMFWKEQEKNNTQYSRTARRQRQQEFWGLKPNYFKQRIVMSCHSSSPIKRPPRENRCTHLDLGYVPLPPQSTSSLGFGSCPQSLCALCLPRALSPSVTLGASASSRLADKPALMCSSLERMLE